MPQQSLPRSTSLSLNDLYGCIRSEMQQVDAVLRRELSDSFPFVDEVVQYAFQLGGKRLRPALVLLVGKAAQKEVLPNGIQENGVAEKATLHELILVAAAIEMIHTATLVHDDILDGAVIRRHLPALHTRWNAGVSVMAGDMIFTKAIKLVARLESMIPYQVIAGACHDTCYGELRQMGTRNEFGISVAEYLDIVAAKTAALLECSCQMGAFYAGAPPEIINGFRLFGRELGMAFQIVDDLLDLIGDEQSMGKTLGTDIAQRKPTLPLLLYFESLPPEERSKAIRQCCDSASDERFVQDLVAKMRHAGAVEAALATARQMVDAATARLDRFAGAGPRSGESQNALDSLRKLARFVVQREK
ncbi:MAG: polyprenyl synthetase family protein [Planctomycetaceae bacterium]|nr:polyprenyl synthetase family protein [Planctomycetaceae bacterium]